MKSTDNKALLVWALVLCMSMGLRCVSRLAGGTEDVNTKAVVGKIYTTNSLPASLTHVQLIPAGYDPVHDTAPAALLSGTTGINGEYLFKVSDSGTYNIYAIDPVDRTCLLKTGVHVIDETTNVGSDSLKQPSIIKILLSGGLDTVHGYVFLPGTIFARQLSGKSGVIEIDSVPCGIVPPINYKENSTAAPIVLSDSILVRPVDSMSTILIGWKLSKILLLNTTSSGAGISGKVIDFPILVRLNSGNFNFSEALPNGSDLRFYKPDNTALPYEIERWDASQSSAEIWVKVDTVFGNDSTHFITMYWGASTVGSTGSPQGSATVSLSNSAAVFDTADGNVGVWHLGPGLDDATPNADNGIDSATADNAGLIGRCRHFDPNQRSFITIPNEARFDLTTKITLSAWVQVDTFSLGWQTIIAKGDDTYRLHRNGILNEACFSLSTLDTANSGYYSLGGSTQIDDHSWHLVCGVFDGAKTQLYVDGKMENDSSVTFPCGMNDLNLTIGDNRTRTLLNTPRFFDGYIDEVRVMRTAVSADWVKLCYMNQMESDKLIIFK